jgi:hypothetical protein
MSDHIDDPAEAAPPVAAVVVDSMLRPGDYFRIAFAQVLRNPASLALFVAGPLLWGFGVVTHSVVVIDLGERVSWLVILVPVFAALVGSFSAYRPGSSALYEKVRWTFAEDGVEIEQPARHAHAGWDEFAKWLTVGGCYLLHTTDRHYIAVAVRDVPEDRRADFEALLAAKIGRQRR